MHPPGQPVLDLPATFPESLRLHNCAGNIQKPAQGNQQAEALLVVPYLHVIAAFFMLYLIHKTNLIQELHPLPASPDR